jgi:hypothetical protein
MSAKKVDPEIAFPRLKLISAPPMNNHVVVGAS